MTVNLRYRSSSFSVGSYQSLREELATDLWSLLCCSSCLEVGLDSGLNDVLTNVLTQEV